MLNPDLKLNPKIFDASIEQKPTRDGYGEGLVLLGTHNENVVVLCADLKESTRCEKFAEQFPDRFFELGVAEQNMATIAAGLGISGKIPFIASYATFSPGRNYEQIRTTIAYNDANVKIAGHHAGVSVGPDGATHQATEDIAIMRIMPNMLVFCPCDAIEAKKMTLAAANILGPVYLRFGREKSPVITTEATPCVPGKAEIFWDSSTPRKKAQCVIFATGILLYEALCAARDLSENNIPVMVVNVHTIKPLDEKNIIAYAKRCGCVVSVEEHQIAGGLGSAIAEVLSRAAPCPMEYVGMHDTFGESGSPRELLEYYGMTSHAIVASVKKVIQRK